MAKNIKRHQSIYLFIVILSIIGFFTGFFFYKTQSPSTKETIKESINIEEDLHSSSNNIIKRSKQIVFILMASLFLITIIINYVKIFIEPFQIGFIFSFLLTYNLKFAWIYSFFYHFIPLIFILILIRISTTISLDIIKFLYTKEQKVKKHLCLILKKYALISIFFLSYELLLAIFSTNLNAYLMTIL